MRKFLWQNLPVEPQPFSLQIRAVGGASPFQMVERFWGRSSTGPLRGPLFLGTQGLRCDFVSGNLDNIIGKLQGLLWWLDEGEFLELAESDKLSKKKKKRQFFSLCETG